VNQTKEMARTKSEALSAVAQGLFAPCLVKEDDGWHARWRGTEDAENPWIDSIVREAVATPLSEHAERDLHPTVHDAWLAALKSRTGLVNRDSGECAAFAKVLERWIEEGVDSPETKRSLEFSFKPTKGGGIVSCPVPRGEKPLRALGRATAIFAPLRRLELSKDAKSLEAKLSGGEAEDFLRYAAAGLAKAGYGVSGATENATLDVEVSLFDAPHGKVRVETRLVLDGVKISPGELRVLLEQKKEYVFFNGHWVKLDRAALLEKLAIAERPKEKRLNAAEAIFLAQCCSSDGTLGAVRTKAGDAIGKILSALRSGAARIGPGTTPAAPGLAGTLRDYQGRAVSWMALLAGLGFGALLADDMGLGKTIETIAWILHSRASGGDGKPSLVVAPITLIANWRRELARFAPGLEVFVHHGPDRALERGFLACAARSDVVITGYSTLVKDAAFITSVDWQTVAIDEAQAVKNPDTIVAHTVKNLKAETRIALTGTPVENSVTDIWSIEEFLNPGLLGPRKHFEERFAKPISENPACAALARLKRTLEPFVLRRLKTDPAIAAEIGDKRVIKEYCRLSESQREEYETALIDYSRGEKRRGDAFALLTRLKLVCDGEGKLERLFDLLESIFAAGESALVFTQYAKVGAAVAAALGKRFGRRFPFLHGALSAKEREREIASFEAQGPCAFVLSLRAGAFGLNLVKATHVIHFDRWWNPAVENQATDRAHRIGQTRTVFVHAFITEGTLEEKVDDLLEKKTRLSGGVVENGESFLLKMSSGEIEAIASLD